MQGHNLITRVFGNYGLYSAGGGSVDSGWDPEGFHRSVVIDAVYDAANNLAKGNRQKGVQVSKHGLAVANLDDFRHERGNRGQAGTETGPDGVSHDAGPAKVVVPVPALVVPVLARVIRTLFVGDARVDNMKTSEYGGAETVGHHGAERKLQFGDFWVEPRQEMTQAGAERGADHGQPDPCPVCGLVGNGSGNEAAETQEQQKRNRVVRNLVSVLGNVHSDPVPDVLAEVQSDHVRADKGVEADKPCANWSDLHLRSGRWFSD